MKAIACAFAVGALAAPVGAAHAAPSLYWREAPPAGGHILLDSGSTRALRISAAAADRAERVTLALLGGTPARLSVRGANPAVATVRFPVPRTLQPRTYVVTVVARTSRPPRVSIARTLIVEVRATTVSLTAPGGRSHWAFVTRAVEARARPSAGAAAVAPVATATTDGTPNLVPLLAQSRASDGTTWIEVPLTALPNGRSGWVPRSALGIVHAVSTRLVVDTRRLTLSLYRAGTLVLRAPVAVGQPQWPTPRGTFYVRERLTHFHDPFYGPIAFGTNARSPTLTDWPGGGIVGIHGTNSPQLIPGRVSHGCIRLRNADILRLARALPLGTPVVIR